MATRSIGAYTTHGIRGIGIDPTAIAGMPAGMTHGIHGAGVGASTQLGTMAGTTHVGRGAGVILTMHGTATAGVEVGTTVGQDLTPMVADSQPGIVAELDACRLRVRRRLQAVALVMHRRFAAEV